MKDAEEKRNLTEIKDLEKFIDSVKEDWGKF